MVRAKMVVDTVTKNRYGQEVVKFFCQYSDNPEDNSFAKTTPSGSMELTIDNEALHGTFSPGGAFYVDLTSVKKEGA